MSLTITDTFNDRITADTESDEDTIYVSTFEDDREATVALTLDQADEFGRALLKDAVKSAPRDGVIVRASEVTFNEGLFRLAAVHGKTVSFGYAKGSGATIEYRRLVPEKVETIKGKDGETHLTFTGYDPDRDDVRAYRIDRVKGEVSVA